MASPDLEHRVSQLEARLAQYQRTHAEEHRVHAQEHAQLAAEASLRHQQITANINALGEKLKKAVGDVYETMGGIARDLGAKADAITAQGSRIESEANKIRLQGAFLARLGLLVVFSASLGGGAVQGCGWLYLHRTQAISTSK
jgi:hypothetical protein